MVSSGITGAVAAESEGLMQDFKAGWMIGSTPRILTYMQLIAVPVGALALAFMYPIMRDTYGIMGEHAQLLSPTSQRWVGFAKVVTRELARAPARSRRGRAARVDEGLVCRRRAGRACCSRCSSAGRNGVGSCRRPRDGHRDADPVQRGDGDLPGRDAGRIWARVAPRNQAQYSIPAASGLIAGEALVAVVIPLLVTLGLLTL